ncbi:MAG: outer membrane lipoprotein LolB [Gammaproteobacteria bacterium]|nr:outer membrane lipoprotein LolB [Gammaproteobacteria bacterium]
MTTLGRGGRGWLRWMVLIGAVLAASCSAIRPQPRPAGSWAQRLHVLQRAAQWEMQGRAAVAIGTHGWQASVDWRQRRGDTVVHLSGPLGVGASVLRLGPDGLSVNDAPPSRDAVMEMQRRIGFDLPVSNLRYWLLGVPDPGLEYGLQLNDQNRAAQLTQAGWTVDFLRYRRAAVDVLPASLVLSRAGVRVRIVIDQWNGVP